MKLTVGIIEECIKQCKLSTHRFRVGAVIFKGKRIISSGHNGVRTSHLPNKYKNYNTSLHAEQAALLHVDWCKIKGCSILVMRMSATTEQLGNALPCTMCQGIIKHVGIKTIWYSNELGQIVCTNI